MRRPYPLKLYLDTTIPNYVYTQHSPERRDMTRLFMSRQNLLNYRFFVSDVVLEEIREAPSPLRQLLLDLVSPMEILPMTPEADTLAREYLRNRILTARSYDDAKHIALATLNTMDALVSWNFGHLVNVRRIRAIHELHQRLGLPMIEIVTPEEVIQ